MPKPTHSLNKRTLINCLTRTPERQISIHIIPQEFRDTAKREALRDIASEASKRSSKSSVCIAVIDIQDDFR